MSSNLLRRWLQTRLFTHIFRMFLVLDRTAKVGLVLVQNNIFFSGFKILIVTNPWSIVTKVKKSISKLQIWRWRRLWSKGSPKSTTQLRHKSANELSAQLKRNSTILVHTRTQVEKHSITIWEIKQVKDFCENYIQ